MVVPLPLLRRLAELQAWRRSLGEPPVLVPTMGALHGAHGDLIAAAAATGRPVLVTVFVNRIQFGPGEDFDRYPRSLDADRALAAAAGATALWAPAEADLYPLGPDGHLQLEPPLPLVRHLCGPGRPGHFRGVATVVSRLLALSGATTLVLGEKDWQQLQVLRAMVRDLGLPVRLLPCPTRRGPDGLPFSSRNSYLSEAERQQAAALPRALAAAAAAVHAGRQDGAGLEDQVRHDLEQAGLQVEYVQLVDPLQLQPLDQLRSLGLLAAAVRCGTTRLIDHRSLMTRAPIVAIDGPAGAGKSTVTRAVARQLGLIHLDTGAMYRAVTWWLQRRGLAPQEGPELQAALEGCGLRLEPRGDREQEVLIGGVTVTEAIRTAEVTAAVSTVAALPGVRTYLTALQRRYGETGGVVAEGRDIGTAVFPDAELKIFLTASVAERVRRRQADLQERGLPVPAAEQLTLEIEDRDTRDAGRAVAPLRRADDAVELVSDGLTIDAVVERIVDLFRERVPVEALLRAGGEPPAR
mgnify:CR=1 FL=1